MEQNITLNPTLVNEFYNLLEETINMYNIPAENIYNIDEKGIQLGIGQKVKAFINHDQKDVYSIQDGNQELIIVIEMMVHAFSHQSSLRGSIRTLSGVKTILVMQGKPSSLPFFALCHLSVG